ncbi:hypothetical protein ACFL6I_10945 [candidate division KSB1 bacterium]
MTLGLDRHGGEEMRSTDENDILTKISEWELLKILAEVKKKGDFENLESADLLYLLLQLTMHKGVFFGTEYSHESQKMIRKIFSILRERIKSED